MRDYLFSGLNEAAAYTRLENICPGGISKWSKESEYMILLFPTNRANWKDYAEELLRQKSEKESNGSGWEDPVE